MSDQLIDNEIVASWLAKCAEALFLPYGNIRVFEPTQFNGYVVPSLRI